MNKHQIRRIDSYVRLSWKTQEDGWRAQQECSSGQIYIGASGRINYLPSNAKQINKRNPMTTSYAYGVAYVTGSPVTRVVEHVIYSTNTIYSYSPLGLRIIEYA